IPVSHAQHRQLRPWVYQIAPRLLRVWVAPRAAAYDDCLCRSRGRGRAPDGRWRELGRADSYRPHGLVAVPFNSGNWPSASPLAGRQSSWLWPPSGPVEEFDGVHYRQVATRGEVSDAADIAGRDEIWPDFGNIRELAVAQCSRNLRLQQIIGPCRAATEMPLRHIDRLDPAGFEKLFRPGVEALSVLH